MHRIPVPLIAAMLFFFIPLVTTAQDVRGKTEDGRHVLLHADGTWSIDSSQERVAYECGRYVEDGESTTGSKVLRTTGAIAVGSPGSLADLRIMRIDDVLVASITIPEASGCFSEDDEIIFFFTDDTRLRVSNHKEFNCDGEATAYAGGEIGDDELVNALSSRTLEAVGVSGSGDDDITVVLVNPLIGEIVRKTVACMMQ